jgi:prepilin-type N-terminal cleavage/methylation domain-containing protein
MYKIKAKNYKLNRGMTYVELIVVLSIFTIMSSIILFNYGIFQSKVDIKVLANDIALKIVDAQKSSISGKWNTNALIGWKPSYGIYFSTSDNKKITHFADINNNNIYDVSVDPILDQITINKNNIVGGIEAVGCSPITNLSIIFRRPDTSAIITSDGGVLSCVSYAKVIVSSSDGAISNIKVYPSGRIQIN